MPTPEIEIIEQDGQFQVVRSVPVTTYETKVVGSFVERVMAEIMADALRLPPTASVAKPVGKGTHASAAEKARAVQMVRDGMTYTDAARALGRSDQAVRDWCVAAGMRK